MTTSNEASWPQPSWTTTQILKTYPSYQVQIHPQHSNQRAANATPSTCGDQWNQNVLTKNVSIRQLLRVAAAAVQCWHGKILADYAMLSWLWQINWWEKILGCWEKVIPTMPCQSGKQYFLLTFCFLNFSLQRSVAILQLGFVCIT